LFGQPTWRIQLKHEQRRTTKQDTDSKEYFELDAEILYFSVLNHTRRWFSFCTEHWLISKDTIKCYRNDDDPL
jgi:hypothetical protein